MSRDARRGKLLVSTEVARALDAEAQAGWGFNVHSLVEAAGRASARVFAGAFPEYFSGRAAPRVAVVSGTGNNGADAMVMLRYWLLSGAVDAESSSLILTREPASGETGPWVDVVYSLRNMNVAVCVGESDGGDARGILARADIIVDGVAGTGLSGPLRGTALGMVNAINAAALRVASGSAGGNVSRVPKRPLVVSVDLPSGNSDCFEKEMPVVDADVTLAIEPLKYCLYAPSARSRAGIILPVTGIFPAELAARYPGAELLDWERARERIPGIRADAYKNKRGTVEVRGGSPGAAGAAYIAARGAQAAGAGLIRIVADDEIYPALASRLGGIMVAPASEEDGAAGESAFEGRFTPDAIVLGPGWGTHKNRTRIIEQALVREKQGVPLILDADALDLVRDTIFSGNTILTPHPGELSRYTGITQDELLNRPLPTLVRYARERGAVILFKAHVMTVAAPDGRVAVIDGMTPGLASGGSGDLLAGFCGAIAARIPAARIPAVGIPVTGSTAVTSPAAGSSSAALPGEKTAREDGRFDLYDCAVAAAALLVASGNTSRFTDPLELAGNAADLAGAAWLGTARPYRTAEEVP